VETPRRTSSLTRDKFADSYGMLLRVGQSERRAPGAAEHHPLLHADHHAQAFDVAYEMPRRVLPELRMGSRSAAASLIEQQHVVDRRIEEASTVGRASASRAAVQEHGGLAASRSDAFPVDGMAIADIEMAAAVRLDRRKERDFIQVQGRPFVS